MWHSETLLFTPGSYILGLSNPTTLAHSAGLGLLLDFLANSPYPHIPLLMSRSLLTWSEDGPGVGPLPDWLEPFPFWLLNNQTILSAAGGDELVAGVSTFAKIPDQHS